MKKLFHIIIILSALHTNQAHTDIIFLEGTERFTKGKLHIAYKIPIKKTISEYTLRLYSFQTATNGINAQIIHSTHTDSQPKAHSRKSGTDALGNPYIDLSYKNINKNILIERVIHFENHTTLHPIDSSYSHPLDASIQDSHRIFLQETPKTQSSEAIQVLTQKLSHDAPKQTDIVLRIFDWVDRNIHYDNSTIYNDAQHTFSSKRGNTEGILNLALTILRQAGIPSRIAVGFTHKDNLAIPQDKSFSKALKIEFPKSLHQWIEVYFPNWSWLAFDPFLLYFFVPTNFIKQYIRLNSDTQGDSESRHIIPASQIQFFIEGAKSTGFQTHKSITSLHKQFISPFLNKTLQKWLYKSRNLFHSPPKPQNQKNTLKILSEPSSLTFDTHQQHLDIKVSPEDFYGQQIPIAEPIGLESIELPLFFFQTRQDKTIDIWLDIYKQENGALHHHASSQKINIRTVPPAEKYQWIRFPFAQKICPPGEYWILLKHNAQETILWRARFRNTSFSQYDSAHFNTNLEVIEYLYLDFHFRLSGTVASEVE